MENNLSLADIAAVTGENGFNGANGLIYILLFAMIFGNGAWGNRGDFGQYATAASQQEILFGQQFQNLDNKMDRLGNGISDATFALNNTIVNGNNNVAGTIISESRSIQDKLCNLSSKFDQSKIDSLQARVNEMQMQNMLCGIPKINPYGFGVYAYNNGPCCNNCSSI